MIAARTVAAAAALVLLAGVVGCGGAGETREPGAGDEAQASRRIVVMAPAAAEMLEALGSADRVVGIGDFVREPPALLRLPRVGSYDTPNVERVLALEADLLLTADSEAAARTHRHLESLGVRVVALRTGTYEGVFDSLRRVGRAVGRDVEALAIEAAMRDELQEIGARADGLSRRRVLFVVGQQPLYVAGPGSHIDEMIELAGGENVMGDVLSTYARVSLESILKRQPDVIIDTSSNLAHRPHGRLAGAWAEWKFLPAVRDGRVYHVDPSLLVIPGMRLTEMTRLMGRLIHPEVFGEVADEDLASRPEPEAAGGA